MQAVWDRIEQLAWVVGGEGTAAAEPLPVALVLDPSLPAMPGLVPATYSAAAALWLPWSQQSQLLHRSQAAGRITQLRTPHPRGGDLVAVALWVEHLHLGFLVSHVPQGVSGPWTGSSAQRLADGIAAALAPRLLRVWQEDRQRIEQDEVLALELERLGRPTADVALLNAAVETLPTYQALRGEVVDAVGSRTFLGAVRGGPSPTGLANIVAVSVRRWLTDLPDPDPATVVDAVHTDLLEILGHLDAEVDLTVCVPRPGRRVAVATTGTAVVAVDRSGRVHDGVGPTGPTLGGGSIGLRGAAELALTGPGFVVAAHGIEDPKLLAGPATYAVQGATDNPMIIASRLRSALVAERLPTAATLLVHGLW